jgi:hypothetical protein
MSCQTASSVVAVGDTEFTNGSHFSLSDLSGGINFDDYLAELEERMGDAEDTTDILTQLQQKERDLLLAAELGKALLERNEELSKRQELLSKDYSARVEVSVRYLSRV